MQIHLLLTFYSICFIIGKWVAYIMFLYLQILWCVFPKNKDILINNHNIVTNFRINIDVVFLSNLPSVF